MKNTFFYLQNDFKETLPTEACRTFVLADIMRLLAKTEADPEEHVKEAMNIGSSQTQMGGTSTAMSSMTRLLMENDEDRQAKRSFESSCWTFVRYYANVLYMYMCSQHDRRLSLFTLSSSSTDSPISTCN